MDNSQAEYSAVFARVAAGEDMPKNNPLFSIGNELMSEFHLAERDRQEVEERWLTDLRQYKGLYEPEQEKNMPGSKAFMRKTRVKVESVDARMMDLLFPANRERNFQVRSTPEPNVPKPLVKKIQEGLAKLSQDGAPPDPMLLKKAIKQAADTAASRMETRIFDQLTEARYRDEARKVLHSGNLYGTGILKGPLVERRTRTSYTWAENKEGGRFEQATESFAAPFLAHVPIWRFYADMAVTDLADARYVWEHHRLSRADLAELATRKTFDSEAVRNAIGTNPTGAIRVHNYEQRLRMLSDKDSKSILTRDTGQYDVYERWGWLTAEQLTACGIEIAPEQMHEAFFSNVWMFPDGQVIKAVLAPIGGMRWPYHLYYVDKDETSIFADGLASIMRGDQEMLNAAVRMLLDNAAVGAGPMFEVFAPYFPPGQNLTDIHALKVFARTSGDPQFPAVRPISANTHINELAAIVEMFDNNADEVTAIPKFTYGDNPQNGAAATMGGLSMLMGQANIALKDFVISWDEGVTKPFISGLYHWNMRFSKDATIKGDYDVAARGAASLVAKEVRGAALAEFAASVQPEERERIKWGDLVRQRSEAHDLSDVIMTDDEYMQYQDSEAVKTQAQMQQMAQQLALANEQAKLAEAQGRTAKASADALRIEAQAMKVRIESIYAAMQAAGVAASNPAVAPAGDAILQSAGFTDATPEQPGSGAELANDPNAEPNAAPEGTMAPEPVAAPDDMGSPNTGQTEGIETAEIVQ